MGRTKDWLLGLSGGLFLALMINFNSLLAKQSSPLFASWVAHGIGALAALGFVMLFSKRSDSAFNKSESFLLKKQRLWTYLGGIPGAFTVILAAITVNSALGFSGALALMMVGQIFFGIVTDLFGLLGCVKRRLTLNDFLVVFSVLMGSWLIIFFGH